MKAEESRSGREGKAGARVGDCGGGMVLRDRGEREWYVGTGGCGQGRWAGEGGFGRRLLEVPWGIGQIGRLCVEV